MPDLSAQSILPFLENIKDPRVDRTKKHLLTDILTIIICAVICGAEGWEDSEIYAEANEKKQNDGLAFLISGRLFLSGSAI